MRQQVPGAAEEAVGRALEPNGAEPPATGADAPPEEPASVPGTVFEVAQALAANNASVPISHRGTRFTSP